MINTLNNSGDSIMNHSEINEDSRIINVDRDSTDDDSDIEEITVVCPPDSNDLQSNKQSAQGLKRRKSSPLLDPIPTYNPTPLHILEQRSKTTSASINQSATYIDYDNITYTPTPLSSRTNDSPSYSTSTTKNNNNDYTPLLGPSPAVVGHTTTPRASTKRKAPPTNSANAVRPVVSSELAQAVVRRRNSQISIDKTNSLSSTPARTTNQPNKRIYSGKSTPLSYAERPVMWSPQLPSQIPPINEPNPSPNDEQEKYITPRPTKQRIAHKPTIPRNKHKQPRTPLGIAKKVPASVRVQYLDIIIKEYLNSGHPEEESYSEALKEEQSLATRAANRSIYINLVASLKKKIREKAGISTLPNDHDPKFVNGNKVVSHNEILTGKVKGTFSIEKKRTSSDPSLLSEPDLYDKLMRYVLPVDQLEAYSYPLPDCNDFYQRQPPTGKDNQKIQLREQLATTYTCERCTKVYRVDEQGLPLSITGKCIYHPGHLWNERINRSMEKRYSCCKNDASDIGCSSNQYHVHKGEFELANYKGYVHTKPRPENDPNRHGIYALDCEMCYTTLGLELTRVTVINYKSEVVYEELVKPKNHILDYNTKFSGIKEDDLKNVTKTLQNVQQDLLEKFSSKTILIGHSLDSDMKALKLFHRRFIDTAYLFPHKRGLPYKRALRTLMSENLKTIIQEDAGHDSKEDASAAFRLVMWKAKTDVPEKAK